MGQNLFDLFMAFFRASILSYGGGPASIPLMQNEVVERYKWFSNNEFADALAIGNTLPGPVAPKMAAYVGYHVAGIWGAFFSVVATVVPTALAMVVLANVLLRYKDDPHFQGMLRVAKPIVVVLLLQAAVELVTKGNYYSFVPVLISVVTGILVFGFKVNPAVIIFGGLAIGFAFHRYI